MTRNIPYRYYKCTLIAIWVFALLCIVGTWLGFELKNNAAVTFSLLVNIFLSISLITLTVFMFMSNRSDYRAKGWIALVLTIIHLGFFISVACITCIIGDNIPLPHYALPSIHTIILVGVVGFGIYFSARNRYVFKESESTKADAEAAFGKGQPEQPEEPSKKKPSKPARDEKTGIVSL